MTLGKSVEESWLSANRLIEAWQEIKGSSSKLQWWLTVPPQLQDRVASLAGPSIELCGSDVFDHQDLQPFDPLQGPELLDPLVSLGLIGLGLEH